MTTITRAPATQAPAIRPRPSAPDFDARLTRAGAVIDDRITVVGIEFAHIDTGTPAEITVPHLPQTATPCPYRTPIAALLHRAATRLQTDGWCRGSLREDDGRRCAIGAIHVEAANQYQADNASALLLEVVRREFQGETVPSWNDAQTSPRPVLLALGRAAELARARSI